MSELEEIVITSDVSVYGKSSAWAAYIKTADDEHKIARTFKKRTKSAQGELYALINAIVIADMLYGIENKKLMIYCDHDTVLDISMRADGTPKKKSLEKFETIKKYLEPYLEKAQEHEVIWIPGHKKADTPQKIREMHMWCDKASRKKCKEMNKELQRKGWYAGI